MLLLLFDTLFFFMIDFADTPDAAAIALLRFRFHMLVYLLLHDNTRRDTPLLPVTKQRYYALLD